VLAAKAIRLLLGLRVKMADLVVAAGNSKVMVKQAVLV